jgi:hypothetical protein
MDNPGPGAWLGIIILLTIIVAVCVYFTRRLKRQGSPNYALTIFATVVLGVCILYSLMQILSWYV